MDRLTIYHTNDIHSQLTYWPRIASYLTRIKKETEHGNVFSFDCGDASDRTHPLAEATDGKAIISLLNEAEYDAVTIGNNEGMGNTKKQLNALYDEADFPVVLSNVSHLDSGKTPNWANKIIFKETSHKRKLGIIACTIPLPTSYTALGWKVEDPLESIQCMLEEYEKEVDGFILLSHLGLSTDRKIASRFDGILAILGGHTHHLLPNGEKLNNTMIAGAGKFGRHIGQVTLEWDDEGQCHSSANVISSELDLPAVLNEKKITANYENQGNRLLESELVSRLQKPLNVNRDSKNDFVSLTLEAMMLLSDADVALINSGLFLREIPAGNFNRKQLHEALPHPMRLVTVRLTGTQMIDLIHSMEDQRNKLQTLEVKGFGFRGKVFGDIRYSRIVLIDDAVYINETVVAEEEEYTIVTVDYFLYVSYFPVLNKSKEVKMISPKFLRNIVADYIKEKALTSKRKE